MKNIGNYVDQKTFELVEEWFEPIAARHPKPGPRKKFFRWTKTSRRRTTLCP